MTAGAEYSRQGNKFCFKSTLQWKQQLFVNQVKIYQFKAKDSDVNAYLVLLGSISKDLAVDNMKVTGLNEYVHNFLVDYESIDSDDILDIYKYLMKKNSIK